MQKNPNFLFYTVLDLVRVQPRIQKGRRSPVSVIALLWLPLEVNLQKRPESWMPSSKTNLLSLYDTTWGTRAVPITQSGLWRRVPPMRRPAYFSASCCGTLAMASSASSVPPAAGTDLLAGRPALLVPHLPFPTLRRPQMRLPGQPLPHRFQLSDRGQLTGQPK
jgi:hypothetical protein